MQYTLKDGSAVKITESTGTMQNIGMVDVEISNREDFRDSFVLMSGQAVSFTEQLWVRTRDKTGQSVKVNVVPFFVEGGLTAGIEEKLNEVGDWKQEGETGKREYVYKNESAPVKIEGITTIEGFETSGKETRIPADSYESGKELKLSGSGYSFRFEGGVKLEVESENTTIVSAGGTIRGKGGNVYEVENVTINGFSEKDTLKNEGNVIVEYQGGASVMGSGIYLKREEGYKVGDKIKVLKKSGAVVEEELKEMILGTAGSDRGERTIVNLEGGKVINALAGDDSITNSGDSVTIYGGVGNDTITNSGNSVLIISGTGNDSIVNSGLNVTIESGAGNDTIYGNGGIKYIFGTNEGTNYIYNYSESDTLKITGEIETLEGEMKNIGYELRIGETTVILVGELGGSEVKVETPTKELKIEIPKILVGTTGNDIGTKSLINTKDDYVMNAQAGNDSLENTGNNVSINGGLGNDTITNTGANVTIVGGAGNDVIIGNGGSVYEYELGNGNDTIFNFGTNDTLKLIGIDYDVASVTGTGFEVKIGSNTILLMGAKKNGTEGKTFADYEKIEAGSILNIVDSTHTTVEVEKIILGTNIGEEITNKLDGYTIRAFNGNDTITNTGNNVTIEGGAGNDSIRLESGSGVVIKAGTGNDTIEVVEGNVASHLYDFTEGGAKVLHGVKSNDTVEIGSSIASASFSGDYYVLNLGNNNTIRLKGEIKGGEYSRANDLEFNLKQGQEVTKYHIPNEIRISGAVTLSSDKNDGYIYAQKGIVISESAINEITNLNADYVSIKGGTGSDTIRILGGKENTIVCGTGNDVIELGNTGHVIEYQNNDGNDTIRGWADNDTLAIYGAQKVSTLFSGKNFGIKVGLYNIIFEGTPVDTKIQIAGDVASIDSVELEEKYIVIPRLVVGTTSADKGEKALKNEGDRYTIVAYAGNDEIENIGNEVSISGDLGNDTITNTGANVTIVGGAGNDSVVNDGNFAYINGGAGNDIISLGANARTSTIIGGAGNDTIYLNNKVQRYVYNKGDGNDFILGYSPDNELEVIGTASINSAEAKVTADGYVIKVGSNTLTLRGEKKKDATGDTVADFEYLKGGTKVRLKYKAEEGAEYENIELEVPYEKVVTKAVSFSNEDEGYQVIGTAVADTITNSGERVTIDSKTGADRIKNTGSNVSINGGADNDTIYLESGSGVTISGGTGDDTIYNSAKGGNVYQFTDGDGKDVIVGFGENDIIEFGSANEYNTKTVVIKNSSKVVVEEQIVYEEDGETPVIETIDGVERVKTQEVEVEVEDEEHKDAVIRVGSSSMTLKGLDKGRKIKFKDGSEIEVQ